MTPCECGGCGSPHLGVIVSDPTLNPTQVYCVAFTSLDVTKDQTCMIEPEENPVLDHPSCINYFDVEIASIAALEASIQCSLIQKRTLCPPG